MTDSITCPRCGMTSHHPADVEQGYCGNCHDWTSPKTMTTRKPGETWIISTSSDLRKWKS